MKKKKTKKKKRKNVSNDKKNGIKKKFLNEKLLCSNVWRVVEPWIYCFKRSWSMDTIDFISIFINWDKREAALVFNMPIWSLNMIMIIYLSIYLSIWVYSSIYLSIYLSIYRIKHKWVIGKLAISIPLKKIYSFSLSLWELLISSV